VRRRLRGEHQRPKSHDIIAQGLKILENMDPRGVVVPDPLVGDARILRRFRTTLHERIWHAPPASRLPAVVRSAARDVASCLVTRRLDYVIQLLRAVGLQRKSAMAAGAKCRPNLTVSGQTVIEQCGLRQAIIASNMSIRAIMRSTHDPLRSRKQILNISVAGGKRNIPWVTESLSARHSRPDDRLQGLLLATQVGHFYEYHSNPLTTSRWRLHPALSTHLSVLEAGSSVPLLSPITAR